MKNSFTIPIIPQNDEERLRALYRYKILDTPPEGAFNRVAELAIKLFKVPIALVSLVDRERVFFKANIGLPGVENVPRGESLCSLAVLQKEPTVFENAAEEPCLLANPLVAGSFGMRFYAGAPLITSDGYNIGTICLVDKKTRTFGESQKEMLQDLAAIVMDEIEIRISAIRALQAQTELIHIAAHDLKNPLSNIQALSELLQNPQSEEAREKMLGMINESSEKTIALINRMVKLSQIEHHEFTLNLKRIDAAELARQAVVNNQLMAARKEQKINLNTAGAAYSYIDEAWMSEVFDNLINNAIKYSPRGKSIEVLVRANGNGLLFQVEDEGLGFSPQDQERAFQKFARLSARPTGGETSTGLGLSIVKTLVELHQGTVNLKSRGKNKGSTIRIEIPDRSKEII